MEDPGSPVSGLSWAEQPELLGSRVQTRSEVVRCGRRRRGVFEVPPRQRIGSNSDAMRERDREWHGHSGNHLYQLLHRAFVYYLVVGMCKYPSAHVLVSSPGAKIDLIKMWCVFYLAVCCWMALQSRVKKIVCLKLEEPPPFPPNGGFWFPLGTQNVQIQSREASQFGSLPGVPSQSAGVRRKLSFSFWYLPGAGSFPVAQWVASFFLTFFGSGTLLFDCFFGEGFRFLDSTKKGGLFLHGHWASEALRYQ